MLLFAYPACKDTGVSYDTLGQGGSQTMSVAQQFDPLIIWSVMNIIIINPPLDSLSMKEV